MPGVIGRWVALAAVVVVIWPSAAQASRVLHGLTGTGYRLNLTLADSGAPERMTFSWIAACRRTRGTLQAASILTPRVSNTTAQAFHVAGAYQFRVRGGYRVRVGVAAHGKLVGPDVWQGTIDIYAVLRRHGRFYDRCRHRALTWIATGPHANQPAPTAPPPPPPPSGPAYVPYNESPKAGAWSLSLRSDPGDPVGFGLPYSYGPPNDTVTIHASRESVSFQAQGKNGDDWTGQFRAPTAQLLHTGTYDGAQERPAADHPGLWVFGNGRGCEHVTGSFTISEIGYDAGGTLQTFKATFQQQCEGALTSLHGTFEFHAAPT